MAIANKNIKEKHYPDYTYRFTYEKENKYVKLERYINNGKVFEDKIEFDDSVKAEEYFDSIKIG